MVSSTCIQCIESYTIKVYSKKDEKTTLTLLSRVSPLTSFLLSHMSPLRRFYVKKAKTSTPAQKDCKRRIATSILPRVYPVLEVQRIISFQFSKQNEHIFFKETTCDEADFE